MIQLLDLSIKNCLWLIGDVTEARFIANLGYYMSFVRMFFRIFERDVNCVGKVQAATEAKSKQVQKALHED